jgi:23S rRNA (adenine2030-N6)-methyltransferase
MNYRHAFHAGNFADCLKHATLARILVHLATKPAPFHVVDTHAGGGLYDLGANAAGRTGEWRDGIARLTPPGCLAADARALLAPWLDAVAAANAAAGFGVDPPRLYPGSPLVALDLMRHDDRLSAVELHPDEQAALTDNVAGCRGARTYALDGWLALKSFLPVRERRGVVLIDPPFEQPGEFDRIVNGLVEATRRFATGIYLVWYPIKDERAAARFRAALVATGIRRILAAELRVAPVADDLGLGATGVVVVNPPWTLAADLKVILPEFARLLGRDGPGRWRLDELVPE